MGHRAQRKQRRQWTRNQRNKRKRDKQLNNVLNCTPPNSPDHEQIDARAETMRKIGRKRIRRDRAKAYRKLDKLQICLFNQRRLVNKWKKRFERLKNKNQSVIEKEVDVIIKRGETRKALLVYQSIANRLRYRYKTTKSDNEKRNISSIICAHKILKRLRLCAYAKKKLEISYRDRRSNVKAKEPRSKTIVVEFLNRDDNSRIKAGKNLP